MRTVVRILMYSAANCNTTERIRFSKRDLQHSKLFIILINREYFENGSRDLKKDE
ncbi:hypothetical protein VIBNISFn118_150003 [Vibrio nigripulchritudo SFn118]|nr:hypothetical protein VIBNISFn118_150003 [Vibrio nigripulchritudo SFn118]